MFTTISTDERVRLARNLALLVEAGIPTYQAITTLRASNFSLSAKRLLDRVRAGLENGQSLHSMFAQEPSLGTLFVALVQAGEASGTLDASLTKVADWLEHAQTMRADVQSATLYPKIVLGMIGIIVVGIMVYILPRLVPLFEGMHVELPLATKILISLTHVVQTFSLQLVVGVVGVFVLYVLACRIPRVRFFRDTFLLHTPFLGAITRAHQLTLATYVIATLYRSGMSLPQALRVASKTVTLLPYVYALEGAAASVEQGGSVAAGLMQYPTLFQGDIIALTTVGEQTGRIADTFERVSKFYAQELSTLARRLPSIIEPMLLILLTLLIGFIAAAIILPVYEITQSISR